jgi:hypothetical protein
MRPNRRLDNRACPEFALFLPDVWNWPGRMTGSAEKVADHSMRALVPSRRGAWNRCQITASDRHAVKHVPRATPRPEAVSARAAPRRQGIYVDLPNDKTTPKLDRCAGSFRQRYLNTIRILVIPGHEPAMPRVSFRPGAMAIGNSKEGAG